MNPYQSDPTELDFSAWDALTDAERDAIIADLQANPPQGWPKSGGDE